MGVTPESHETYVPKRQNGARSKMEERKRSGMGEWRVQQKNGVKLVKKKVERHPWHNQTKKKGEN